jgi:hypothetical protein
MKQRPAETGKREPGKKSGRRRGRQQGPQDGQLAFSEMVTTISVSGIAPEMTTDAFMAQMESWGLAGTFDFLQLRFDEATELGAGFAVINFIDASFVLLFCWIYRECGIVGMIGPADAQGYEANLAQWAALGGVETAAGAVCEPILLPRATPSQECVNVVNTMLSPQFREQFHKTKLCAFHKKNKCEMGASCPFAHSQEELQPAPDLVKTKLCYNYYKQKCTDPRCKFAHGAAELRSVWMPYSPGNWGPDAEGKGSGAEYAPLGEEGAAAEQQHGALVAMMGQALPVSSCEMHGGYAVLLSSLGMEARSAHLQEQTSSSGRVDSERSDGEVDSFGRATSQDEAQGGHLLPFVAPLRMRGTFLEVVPDQGEGECHRLKRCWSEGDLDELRAATMAEVDLSDL